MTRPHHKVKQREGVSRARCQGGSAGESSQVGTEVHGGLQVACLQQQLLPSPAGQASGRARPIGQSEPPRERPPWEGAEGRVPGSSQAPHPCSGKSIYWVCEDTRSRESTQAISNLTPQYSGPHKPPGNTPLGWASIWMAFRALLTPSNAVFISRSLMLGHWSCSSREDGRSPGPGLYGARSCPESSPLVRISQQQRTESSSLFEKHTEILRGDDVI